jgi:hypothetical protein
MPVPCPGPCIRPLFRDHDVHALLHGPFIPIRRGLSHPYTSSHSLCRLALSSFVHQFIEILLLQSSHDLPRASALVAET